MSIPQDHLDRVIQRYEERKRDGIKRVAEEVYVGPRSSLTPGYSRPLVRVSDYLALLERSTYDGSRVRS